jgi:hypothetical protein
MYHEKLEANETRRVYVGRTFGGYYHHWNPYRVVAARRAGGTRSRTPDDVQQSDPTVGFGFAQLPLLVKRLPNGRGMYGEWYDHRPYLQPVE